MVWGFYWVVSGFSGGLILEAVGGAVPMAIFTIAIGLDQISLIFYLLKFSL